MQPGEVIQDRYHIIRPLGARVPPTTFLARDTTRDRDVVVKVMSVGTMGAWRDLDVLENEARVLRSLDHPNIPDYVDFLKIGEERGATFVLVQEYIDGTTLQEKVQQGWRADDGEIRALALGLLRIIRHIHSLHPPLIHRDINPKNVILGDDGQIYLVDFGRVQDALPGGGMVALTGTPDCTPRSDLYAFAATMAFMLTHRHPADLPRTPSGLDLSFLDSTSPELAHVLRVCLDPVAEGRSLDVDHALDILEGRRALPSTTREPPYASRISVQHEAGAVEITVPHRGPGGQAGFLAVFSVAWLGFVALWTVMTVLFGAPLPFTLFSIPFWLVGIVLLRKAVSGLVGRTWIAVRPGGELRIRQGITAKGREIVLPVRQVGSIRCDRGCRIEFGAKTVVVGELLSEIEQRWLADSLNAALGRDAESR